MTKTLRERKILGEGLRVKRKEEAPPPAAIAMHMTLRSIALPPCSPLPL